MPNHGPETDPYPRAREFLDLLAPKFVFLFSQAESRKSTTSLGEPHGKSRTAGVSEPLALHINTCTPAAGLATLHFPTRALPSSF